ncbi:D-2-hydroxyacid dehydrogenase [Hymenobacter defluvii]|uniref:D-2-hydroxyacid dehydrogenase n=1 Tax=Hymenobacter defluvii TaxID=2054411 RepID=A0ABS3TDP6_9BACT|nr:D-2-hydroxyacid dehydrogenase [Hymenobacter defluvii]MBO3271478.1 D-2-hydroxyacid dehydrogenase [Hymenobacter defluvii]
MHLFVYTPLTEPERQRLIDQLPDDVHAVFRTQLEKSEEAAAFQKAELLLGNPPPEWFAQHEPNNLQFWQIDSAGFERYQDLRPSYPVANMGDYFAWPCAETMVAGLLAHYRHLPELLALQGRQEWHRGSWQGRLGLLREKRVIILGSGTIGQAVKQQLTGFNCHVQLLARTDPRAQLHSKDELRAALPNTDIVVNCLPGSADGFFSAELIEAMPTHSVYASVGRGNTTDEPALIAALRANRLAGAVLDVTAQEPLPSDSPLWTMPHVILTQHTGGNQPGENDAKVDQFLRNLHRFQRKQELENSVDVSKGY